METTTAPDSILSAPPGRHVIAVIGGDGCAAVLDDSAPAVALASGTVLLVSPGRTLRVIWGGTCGWTAWCLDAALVRRASVRAGLERIVSLRAAALPDGHACRALMTALVSESARSAHPAQRLLVQSLADALPVSAHRKWYGGATRNRDASRRSAA
jgi:hypothetical protein